MRTCCNYRASNKKITLLFVIYSQVIISRRQTSRKKGIFTKFLTFDSETDTLNNNCLHLCSLHLSFHSQAKGCMNCLVEESSDLERFPLSDLNSPRDSNILLIPEHFSGLQKCQQALSTANQRNPLACNTIVGNSVTHWKERRFFLPESQSSVHNFCFLKIFISYIVMVDLCSCMQVKRHACG